MVFSSLMFLFFFLPPLILLYFIVPDKMKNILLVLFSLFFYAWGEPIFVLLMIFATAVDYTAGRMIGWQFDKGNPAKAKIFLIVSIVMNLGLLSFFKYADFFIGNINLIPGIEIAKTGLPLPIGISFYTFQTMSYTIDVYRKEVAPQKSFLNLLLFTTLFPQLIAGPIVRYQTIEEQVTKRHVTLPQFTDGVIRFTIGLGKKILIANKMAVVADFVFSQPAGELAVGTAWLGIIAYTMQIYFDFSGYSDMAIGLGKMFGFEFLENFDYPYISCSVTEFWRRWHMSLGTWFRDYLYFPLGGSRVDTKFKLIRNLFIVWFLTGLWHGAAWNFALWGLFYFFFIAAEKLIGINTKSKYSLPRNMITMLIVMLGWVLFRSNTAAYAADFIKTLFGASGTPLSDNFTVYYFYKDLQNYLIAIIASLPVIPVLRRVYQQQKNKLMRTSFETVQFVFIGAVFVLSVIYLVNESYNPFIYFRF